MFLLRHHSPVVVSTVLLVNSMGLVGMSPLLSHALEFFIFPIESYFLLEVGSWLICFGFYRYTDSQVGSQ